MDENGSFARGELIPVKHEKPSRVAAGDPQLKYPEATRSDLKRSDRVGQITLENLDARSGG
jgi:hypothetical protein